VDKKDWIKCVSEDGLALEQAPEAFRCDDEVVFKALQNNGLALQFASPALRADRGLVWTAVSNNGMAIRFAAAKLRDDPMLADLALVGEPLSLRFLSKNLRCDVQIILSAVRKDPEAFRYATKVARADRYIVAEVVDCDGRALRYAEKTLRRDPGLIELSEQSIARIRRRVFDPDASRKLISYAMKKGFLLDSDIEKMLPTYVLSRHERMLVADTIRHDVGVDTFPVIPSDAERRATMNGLVEKAFKDFISPETLES
jgi:hypothetical protein